jgi:excisionase family DNA binding protein
MEKDKAMLTVPEAARALGLTTQTIRTRIARGHMTAVKYGRDWLLTPAEVERWKRFGRLRAPNGQRRRRILV